MSSLLEQLKAIEKETHATITINTPFKLNKKSKEGVPNQLGELTKHSTFYGVIGKSYADCHFDDTGLVYVPTQSDKPSPYQYINKALSEKDGEYYLKCAYLSSGMFGSVVYDKEGNEIPSEVYSQFKGASKSSDKPTSYRMIKLSNIKDIKFNM